MFSRYLGSHSCLKFEILSKIGNKPKFIDPIFNDVISGLALTAAAKRSSTVIPRPPPVEIFTTASVACLILGKNCIKTSGSGLGLPFSGSRACKCIIEAPASQAPIDSSAISSGVIGKCSLIVGV